MIVIPYKDLLESSAKTFGLDPALIAAIIKVESNWDPRAKRYEPSIRDSSYGLMQLLSRTASIVAGRTISEGDLYRPEINIYLGSKYLADLLTRYGDEASAVSAYNAGQPTTANQDYVNRVLGWKKVYAILLPYGDYIAPAFFGIAGLATIVWDRYVSKERK